MTAHAGFVRSEPRDKVSMILSSRSGAGLGVYTYTKVTLKMFPGKCRNIIRDSYNSLAALRVYTDYTIEAGISV